MSTKAKRKKPAHYRVADGAIRYVNTHGDHWEWRAAIMLEHVPDAAGGDGRFGRGTGASARVALKRAVDAALPPR